MDIVWEIVSKILWILMDVTHSAQLTENTP